MILTVNNHHGGIEDNDKKDDTLAYLCKSDNHLGVLRYLFERSDEIIIASPFLFSDFSGFFKSCNLSNLSKITLITTCRPEGDNQVTKPFSLRNFTENIRNHTKIKWPIIHINQKLHGKLYFFSQESSFFASIITSANFTNNGLKNNDEYGILIQDAEIISGLHDDLMKGNDYVNLSEYHIDRLCVAADHMLKNDKRFSDYNKSPQMADAILNLDIGLNNILNNFCTPSEGNKSISLRREAKFFVKVSGVTDRPILPQHKEPNDEPQKELWFAKKPKNLSLGDCLLEVAVGGMCFLGYFACASAVYERTVEEKEANPDHKRWPYYIYGNNMSLSYGKVWFDSPLYYDEVIKEFLSDNPTENVTPSGKKHILGAIQLGHSYFQCTDIFAKFVMKKIDKFKQ